MQGLIGILADSGSSHGVWRREYELSPEAGAGAWQGDLEDEAWAWE